MVVVVDVVMVVDVVVVLDVVVWGVMVVMMTGAPWYGRSTS